MGDTVVICGALAQKPGVAGHTWQFLQYLLGFRRLGWEVLFLDRLEPAMCVDADGCPCPWDESINAGYVRHVMERFGLEDSYAVLCDGGRRTLGVSRANVLERTRRAAFLLNIMGYVDCEDVLAAARRRVFLDTDPGVGQMWKALGLADVFRGHDDYVTIGERIGDPDCRIPTCGMTWLRFRQPVVLDYWPPAAVTGGAFRSIATWRGSYAPIEYGGRMYGQRVHEFRRYFAIPKLTGRRFELALDIDPCETRDLTPLNEGGWTLLDPRTVTGDPWRYREFIQASMAEFMVAKGIVVDTNSGWFSDRTMCFLASGKPALVQDTGLGGLYPVGEGLLTFRTVEDAAAAVDEICGHYERHARAARELAEAYFDSDKVLMNLLAKLGI